jgi:hypothetical protein
MSLMYCRPCSGGEMRRLHPADPRERLEQRRDVVAQLPIRDPSLPQDMPREHVEVELRGDRKMPRVRQDRIDQPRMIEDRVARLAVAEEVD